MKYLVLTRRTPNFRPELLREHYAFLDRLREDEKLEMAGPFTDRSGGAYVVIASDLEQACRIAHTDPLRVAGSSHIEVHEWDVS